MITAEKQSTNETLFGRAVRSAIRGVWYGELDIIGFADSMQGAIFRAYEQAWREGSEQCGISPAERTQEEQAALDAEIASDQGYILGLYDRIDNMKLQHAETGKPTYTQVVNQAKLWANRYNAVRNLAQRMACSDQKLIWRMGPTREHCVDCQNYEGRVYRASVWDKYGIRPQSRDLSCHGYNCLCYFEPTDAPGTPGRPPLPRGR